MFYEFIFSEIFPEVVVNTIFKCCVHPMAEAYIRGTRERLRRPYLERLNELKMQLYDWETSEDPILVVVRYGGYRNIDEYDSFGVEAQLQINWIEPFYNKVVGRISNTRQFSFSSDDVDDEDADDDAHEDIWYTFEKTSRA